MWLPVSYFAVVLLWAGSELAMAIALRSRDNLARGADRASLAVLWTAIAFAVVAGNLVRGPAPARLPGPALAWALLGIELILAGLALRWTAILTLRRAFTVDVAIAPGQRLVERGIYAVLRHPAYSGSLLSFLGFALVRGNGLVAGVVFVPVAVAFSYRIRVEERALREAFGADYERYCRGTRRLVPFVY